jgi:hypothetical protein
MAYSALFNNVFEAVKLTFNNFFYTNAAEIQLPGNDIQSHSATLQNTEFWLEFCHG